MTESCLVIRVSTDELIRNSRTQKKKIRFSRHPEEGCQIRRWGVAYDIISSAQQMSPAALHLHALHHSNANPNRVSPGALVLKVENLRGVHSNMYFEVDWAVEPRW